MFETKRSTARTIAIGDVHGCATQLRELLEKIAPSTGDTIVMLGDYIDRGPDSRDVLEQLLTLRKQCHLVPLLGNHEVMMLDALHDDDAHAFWVRCGGQATLESYECELPAVPGEHWDFLANCCLGYETDKYIFVHANYDPHQPVEWQNEHVLRWQHLNPADLQPHCSGKTVVVGHTPQRSGDPLDLGHLICLDTHCFAGGPLTAMELGTREVWQAG